MNVISYIQQLSDVASVEPQAAFATFGVQFNG